MASPYDVFVTIQNNLSEPLIDPTIDLSEGTLNGILQTIPAKSSAAMLHIAAGSEGGECLSKRLQIGNRRLTSEQ